MKEYLVYKHTNLSNGKVYIGITCYQQNPNLRWRNGFGYQHQNFYKAIQKYGWENFSHDILEKNIPENLIGEREKYWIAFYESNNPKYGYNCTDGGMENYNFSEESSQKIKDSFTEKRREEYSQRLKKRWEEDSEFAEKATRARNSKQWHPVGELNPMYGKKRSGKEAGNAKKVKCIETGEVFDTVTDASKWCNNGSASLRSHIAQNIRGKRKSSGTHPVTGEKLHWCYVEESEVDY